MINNLTTPFINEQKKEQEIARANSILHFMPLISSQNPSVSLITLQPFASYVPALSLFSQGSPETIGFWSANNLFNISPIIHNHIKPLSTPLPSMYLHYLSFQQEVQKPSVSANLLLEASSFNPIAPITNLLSPITINHNLYVSALSPALNSSLQIFNISPIQSINRYVWALSPVFTKQLTETFGFCNKGNLSNPSLNINNSVKQSPHQSLIKSVYPDYHSS